MTKLFLLLLFCVSGLSDVWCQVNTQNGSATFSIPVYNWQDNKSRLRTSVSLAYQSGNGIRANELASNVGQGWMLMQGGVITRSQVGLPDDQRAYCATNPESEKDLRKYPNGRLWVSQPANLGYHPQVARYPLFRAKNEEYNNFNGVTEDKQLDYFSFQFNGKTGVFVIDPAEGGIVFTLEESRLKITFQHDLNLVNQGIRTTITSFTIQDEDGLIYRFSNKALSKILRSRYTDKNWNSQRVQPNFQNNRVYYQTQFDVGPSGAPWINSQMANPFIVNAWHLTEVEDPLTGRKILYNYTTQQLNINSGFQISNVRGNKEYALLTRNRSIVTNQVISNIQFPDGRSVSFGYGVDRADLPGDKALSFIDVNYIGRKISRHELRTAYMVRNRYASHRYLASNDRAIAMARRMARLCLRSVVKYGPDLKEDESLHQFDYYLGTTGDDLVPAPFNVNLDNWGYYNGDKSQGFSGEFISPVLDPIHLTYAQAVGLVYLRQGVSGPVLVPKTAYARNGLLRQIVFPQGGTMTYEYEQNRANLNGEKEVGGVRVSKTITTDGGGSNDCSNPIETSYRYVLNDGVSSSMWGVETPLNYLPSSANYRPVVRYWTWGPNSGIFGRCDFRFKFPGLLSIDQAVDPSMLTQVMTILTYGLGIYGLINTAILAVKAIAGLAPLIGLVIDLVISVISLGISCVASPNRDIVNHIYVNADVNQASPLPNLYRRVEIIQGSGTMGKVIQEYSDQTIPGGYYDPSSNTNLTRRQRFSSWAYGLPTRTTILNASGSIVSETINEYQVRARLRGACLPHNCPPNPRSSNYRVLWNRSQRVDHWANEGRLNNQQVYLTASTSDIAIEYYGYWTGKSLVIKTINRKYRTDGVNYVEDVTNYTYNSNNDLITVESQKSNGDRIYKGIKYNTDFNSGLLSVMRNNNILSIPITVSTYGILNGQMRYLDETVSEFTQAANGDIKPWRILKQRFREPSTSISLYQGPGTGISQYAIEQEYIYNPQSLLSGVRDEGGRISTNLYDYDDQLVSAAILNAHPNDDKPAYSSFETSNLGGWTLIGVAGFQNSPAARTGLRTFTMLGAGANQLTAAGLNVSRSYTVSFWADGAGVVVSNGSLTKSGPAINGMTYYEYNVPAGISSVAVNKPSAGNVNIDELRLHPASARMNTTTFDPIIGKTSESDENSRTVYYEYDNVGRPSLVRDEQRNIVKAYEYNSINPVYLNGCPKTYFNKLVAEDFTKNNCPQGFIGSDVTYTIPANRYSSTISQEDADLKAEAELIREGQSYANTYGFCQQIFYNSEQTRTFTTENCNPGFIGGQVSYTVPANRYTSLISPADANQQALEEIEDNGQAFANGAGAVCLVTTSPQWEHLEIHADSFYCQSINGQLPPQMFVLETDVNPNSPTFNQRRWSNVGPNESCPANTYFSAARSQTFTRNNCSAGQVGSNWTYTVPPGKYSSTVSQSAADQLAINEINANGQNAANQFGTCVNGANVISSNTRAFNYTVRFTNSSTGIMYQFVAPSNRTQVLGAIPHGTYSVFICPSNNPNPNNRYSIGSVFVSGVVCGTLNNIVVFSSSVTVNIN